MTRTEQIATSIPSPTKQRDCLTILLFLNVISLLTGRSWQHLFASVPVRALLWNDELFRPLIEMSDLAWSDYVASLQFDQWITYLTYGFGIFYLLVALTLVVSLYNRTTARWLPPVLFLTAFFLFLLAYCYFLDKNYLLGQWGEYALQWMSPLFLSWYVFQPLPTTRLILLMKIALAVTFVCHGLYAVGYYPVPGSFQTMLMRIFPLTEIQTLAVLKVAGLLDFVLSILILLPHRKIVLTALGYATIWGLLTALARPVAHFYPQFWLDSLAQWTPELLFRVPHFIIPAWLFLFYWRDNSPTKPLSYRRRATR